MSLTVTLSDHYHAKVTGGVIWPQRQDINVELPGERAEPRATGFRVDVFHPSDQWVQVGLVETIA